MYGSNDPLKDLNLSGVQAREGLVLMQPGRHSSYVSSAKINTSAKTKRFEVVLVNPDTGAQITARINLWSESAKAVEIAKEQLKSLCVFGEHPNPDHPFLAGVEPMIGMPVGTVVAMGNPYKDDKGVERVSPEVKGFFKLDPEEHMRVRGLATRAKAGSGQLSLSQMASGGSSSKAEEHDDEIPF